MERKRSLRQLLSMTVGSVTFLAFSMKVEKQIYINNLSQVSHIIINAQWLYKFTINLTRLQILSNMLQEQEVEEPVQVIEEQREQPTDHIPLKDEFSSDLSEIDVGDLAERMEEAQASQRISQGKPKKKKIAKNFRWKNKWIAVPNIIQSSAPLLQKRWVKVKCIANEEQIVINEQRQQKDNALKMAHAIIQGQKNNQ